MADKKSTDIVPVENVGRLIRIVRGQKVILDSDLAQLYEVETKTLNRAVKRNIDRFPDDFMFQLTKEEFLRCQIGTSSEHGGRRYTPYAFTEQGVAMLSGLLNSTRAIQANIAIMRAFVRIREILASNRNIEKQLKSLDKKVTSHDKQFKIIFDTIAKLMAPDDKNSKRPIGFKHDS